MPPSDRGSRIARWAVLGLLASGIVLPPSQADEPTITRDGPASLLKAEDDLKDRVEEIKRRFERWDQGHRQLAENLATLGRAQTRYQDLLRIQKALEEEWQTLSNQSEGPPPPRGFDPPPPPDFGPPPGFDSPPPPDGMKKGGPPGREGFHRSFRSGEIRRQYGNLQAERALLEAQIVRGQFSADRVAGQLESDLQQIERRREQVVKLDQEIRARSATRAAEPSVKQASSTTHETSNTKDLQAIANEMVEARRMMQDHRVPFELKGMSRIAGLAGAGEALQHELGLASGRLLALEHDSDSREKMLAEEQSRVQTLAANLRRATGSQERDRLAAQVDTAKARIEKHQAEEARTRGIIGEVHEQISTSREDFLRIVAALRESLDTAINRREDLANDSQARREILKPPPGKKTILLQSPDQIARRLKELEKVIRTEKVPIDPDRTILWVDATLNGKPGQAMILDLRGEDIRLSARVAAEVGVQTADDDPIVEVATSDGRAISARRARLATVQVGPCTVANVECLVLPEDYGDVPSLLGGSFLKRFASRVDADAGTLVLTQVQVKPILRAGKGR